ncbi:MAG: sensor domain-containing diguanylate cyclase [Pseudomonadota bacterium]
MGLSRLHPQEFRRLQEIEVLQLTTESMEACFDRLTSLIKHVLNVEVAAFSIVDMDRVYFKSLQGQLPREMPRGIAFCSSTILGQAPLVINDASKDSRFSDNPLVACGGIRFYAGVPVRGHDGLPVGTLCALDSEPQQLSEQQLKMLLDVRDVLEDTLIMRSLSSRDQLTGLFNRRYFDEFFDREWRRGCRSSSPLSLLMVDVDHFKSYNDDLGHQQGDTALKLVAHQLSTQLRRGGDFAARYGGEEFVIVLPETSAADAAGVAVHLRDSVERLRMPHPGSQSKIITISIGGASAQIGSDYVRGKEVLLQRADLALYKAKTAGRNRALMH